MKKYLVLLIAFGIVSCEGKKEIHLPKADRTIIGDVKDVYEVFQLIEVDGPALGLHLNVKKNEIWWPASTMLGQKLLGALIGTKAFTTDFVKKKLECLTSSEER